MLLSSASGCRNIIRPLTDVSLLVRSFSPEDIRKTKRSIFRFQKRVGAGCSFVAIYNHLVTMNFGVKTIV